MNVKLKREVNGTIPETGGELPDNMLKMLVHRLVKNQAQLYVNTNFDLLLEMDSIQVTVNGIRNAGYDERDNSVNFKAEVTIEVAWNLKEAIKETLEVALNDTPFLILKNGQET